MFRLTTSKAAIAASLLGLAACSSGPVTTRGPSDTFDFAQNTHQLVTRSAAMTQLARRFNRAAPAVIHFDFNSDRLDWRARRNLDAQAEWIIAHPNVRFAVTGHTDRVGPNSYNDELGMRRAKTALSYLVSQGVEEFRLIAMVSEGEESPIIDVDGRERANRRVETEVIGIVADNRRRMRAGDWVFSSSDSGRGQRFSDDDENSGPPLGGRGPLADDTPPSDPPPSDPPSGPPPSDPPSGPPPSDPPSGPPPSDPPVSDPPSDPKDKPKGWERDGHMDAGGGNGDDGGDPGNSGGNNHGGDEVVTDKPRGRKGGFKLR